MGPRASLDAVGGESSTLPGIELGARRYTYVDILISQYNDYNGKHDPDRPVPEA
jgi:hypothetical protein